MAKEFNPSDWERVRQVLKVEESLKVSELEHWARRWPTYDRRAFYSLIWEMCDAGAIVKNWDHTPFHLELSDS